MAADAQPEELLASSAHRPIAFSDRLGKWQPWLLLCSQAADGEENGGGKLDVKGEGKCNRERNVDGMGGWDKG